jgi:hypothetical protein
MQSAETTASGSLRVSCAGICSDGQGSLASLAMTRKPHAKAMTKNKQEYESQCEAVSDNKEGNTDRVCKGK